MNALAWFAFGFGTCASLLGLIGLFAAVMTGKKYDEEIQRIHDGRVLEERAQ